MLRVMTWNIRTGGRDRGGPDRLDQVVQVVDEQAPDVLALQELRGFDRDGLMATVAARGVALVVVLPVRLLWELIAAAGRLRHTVLPVLRGVRWVWSVTVVPVARGFRAVWGATVVPAARWTRRSVLDPDRLASREVLNAFGLRR